MRLSFLIPPLLCLLPWSAVAAGKTEPSSSAVARRANAYQAFFEARELVAQGRSEEARRKLEEVLKADPEAAVVYAALARLCLKDGDVLCAEARARRAVELSPDEADGHKVLAEIALQQRQHGGDAKALDDALLELAAAAAAQPADSWVWGTWIRTLAGEGRFSEAEAVARRAAGVPGLDPAAPWITLARVLLSRGDSAQATAILEGANVPGRGAGPILEMLADLKGNSGDLAGRAAALSKLRELRADDPELAHRLGAVRLDLGDFYGALGPLEEAFGARDSDPIVRRDLARALVRLGRGAEALKLLRGLPDAYQTPHTLLLWAQAAEQAGEYAESADRLEQLLTKLSDADLKTYGSSVRLQAARARLRIGAPEQALALVRDHDEDPAALRVELQALEAAGRGKEAETLIRTRRAAQPESAGLVALIAERAARTRGADAGLEAALGEIRQATDKGVLAAQTASWLTTWDQAALGARVLDAVGLPENPNPAQLRARAATLHAAGRLGEAEAAFRRLLELNPEDDAALNNLGFLLASEGRSLDEALQMLEKAVQMRPDEPAYLDSLGWALHLKGRSAEALPLLTKAAQKSRERDEPGIREHLGDVYRALGDPQRARAEWEAALAMGSDRKEQLRKKIAQSGAARSER